MTSLPEIRVEFLPTATPGDAATLRLEISEADLKRGCEFWIRGTEDGPYQRLNNTTAALAVTWQGDLQLLEVVCFCPESRRFFTCREYLRRQPSTEIHVQATDHAVTYVAPPDTATDLWESQHVPGHSGGWSPLKLPRAELVFDAEVCHALLSLEHNRMQPAKQVAVTLAQELTVGRLHQGPARRLNQSRRGAHWHLGWQRITAAGDRRSEGVTGDLMEKSRDWMSRSAGSLRMDSPNGNLGLKATSLGPPEEFQLHQRSSSKWELELTWSTYSDSLLLHAEEASGEIAGRQVQLPWFWAARRQIVPELEDRFYLWLPGWEHDLPALVGAGGWLGEEIRWLVEDGCLVFVDAAEFSRRD